MNEPERFTVSNEMPRANRPQTVPDVFDAVSREILAKRLDDRMNWPSEETGEPSREIYSRRRLRRADQKSQA